MTLRLRFLLCLAALCLPLLCPAQLRRGEVTIEFRLQDGLYMAQVNRYSWSQTQTVRLCPESALNSLPVDHKLYEGQLAQKAYALLMAPLESYLKKGDKIYYSPVGRLHFINLDALVDSWGRRLFDRYQLFRVTDTKELPYRPKEKQFLSLILFGGMDYKASPDLMIHFAEYCHTPEGQSKYEDCQGLPLENVSLGHTEDGTRAGVGTLINSKDEIKSIYHSRHFFARPHTGAEASEEIFRSEMGGRDPYIIHLSTHTFNIDFNRQAGESDAAFKRKLYKSCGLLFSGAGHTLNGEKLPYNLNDGLLYAEEIASLDMSGCTMVVLGACNTALGVVTQDGILGLQSAFKEAGAQTLLMTLWSVNDKATSEFMKRFYSYLFDGKTKHESLRRARADLMASPDFNDPLYWAPFIMLD